MHVYMAYIPIYIYVDKCDFWHIYIMWGCGKSNHEPFPSFLFVSDLYKSCWGTKHLESFPSDMGLYWLQEESSFHVVFRSQASVGCQLF